MSFTVYNGLKVKDTTSVAEVMQIATVLRLELLDSCQREQARKIKLIAALLYDRHHVYGVDPFDDSDTHRIPLLTATYKLERIASTADAYEHEYTIGFANAGDDMYALPIFPSPLHDHIIANHELLSPCGYWDNVDPEEGVSEAEWSARENVWTGIMSGTGIPSECMLMIKLLDVRHLRIEDCYMEQDALTLEERELGLVQYISYQRAGYTLGSDATMKDVIKQSNTLRPKITDEIHGKLLPELTMEELSKPIPKKEV